MRYILLFLFSFIFFSWDIHAQCGFVGNELIPDASTTQISLGINGAISNNLSTPGQGICKINISFRHSHVGDLSIKLHSPSGQVITLIGNVGNSANTTGSLWDVHFIPTGGPPMPDIGILPIWSNTSNWQANSNYSGTYFPVAGNNLGQINSGTVNGLWTIELIDGSSLDVGELLSFSIEFCEPAGINCSSCYKKAGVLPTQDITACAGSPELNTNINPTFPNGSNGPNTSYKFIVSSSNDKIIALLDAINLQSFPKGDYTVCGFAYDSNNSNLLPKADSTESFTTFKNLYYNGTPQLCGDLTETCLSFHILESSPLQEFTKYICGAGPIIIEGQSITAAGVYNFSYSNQYGCDSSLSYDVLPITFNPVLTVSNVLTCVNNSATIHTNSVDFPIDSYYSWISSSGVISSGINVDSLLVSTPGIYFLALEKDNCRDTISINVKSDITLPQITMTSTQLSCAMPIRTISVVSNPLNVTIQWSGPNGYSSTQAVTTVMFPGIYNVKVTKTDGCSITGQIEVTGDFEPPAFDFIYPLKTCANETATISITTTAAITQYSWTLPDGTNANTSAITTAQNGWTYLTVTGSNGCKYTDSLNIGFLYQNPILAVRDTFINCTTPQLRLPVTAQNLNFTIIWNGPGGFTSTEVSPLVSVGGTYTAVAAEPNGCSSDVTIVITEDFVKPKLNIPPASFGCMQNNLVLNTTPIPMNVVYNWTGPKNYTSNLEDPTINETGWYYVTVTGKNGCTKSDSILVGLSPQNPNIMVQDDSLTCTKDSAQLFVKILSPANGVVSWTGPGGFSSNIPAPFVDVPGKYWVKVINPTTGCFTNKSVIITDLTTAPVIVLYQDSLNCNRNQARFGFIPDPLIADYYWILPNNDTIRNKTELFSATVDTFRLVVINLYGCRIDTFIHIAVDASKPVININDQFISCASPFVTLQVSASKPIVNILWTFPDGSQSMALNPITSQYGIYKVRISGANGCADSATMRVLPDTISPDVKVFGGTYTCKQKFFTLGFNSSLMGSIEWSGPDNFISNDPSPQVNVSGNYVLTITSINGCIGRDSSIVTLSDKLPDLALKDDSITCKQNPLVIKPLTNALDPNFNWITPSGGTSTEDSLIVSQPGIYTLTLTDAFECILYDTAFISIDTLRPVSIILDNYFLDCNNDSLMLKASDSIFYSFEWFNEIGSTIGNDSLQLITDAGLYTLKLTGLNGCANITPFNIITDYQKPDLEAIGGELNCDYTKIELVANSNTPGVQFEWNINGVVVPNRTHIVDQVGQYMIKVTGANGCISDSLVRVDSNYIIPELVTTDGSLSCDSSNYLLAANTSSIGSTFGWFGPDNFFSDKQFTYANQVGTYYIFLKGANGCLNVDTIEIDDDPPHPQFSLFADSITCFSPFVPIGIIYTDSLEKYEWTGPQGFTSMLSNVSASNGGLYYLTAYGDNGCETRDSINVIEDNSPPEALFTATDSIVCKHRVIELFGNVPPIGDNYTYSWNTNGGQIISSKIDTNVTIKNPGLYSLTTFNLRNGCSFAYSEDIEEKPNRIDEILVDIKNTACKELSNGIITVDSVPFSIGSLKYSIIAGFYGVYNYFNRLSAGEYTIGVIDEYGCTFEQSFTMGVEDPISVDLGPDTIITLGQKVLIKPEFIVDSSDIIKVVWVNAPSDCGECLEFIDGPLKTTTYKIIIYNADGCIDEDEKQVFVNADDHLFVPNIFSPNGDGVNDILQISVNESVKLINSIKIFDRWGNNVYSANGLEPLPILDTWDGTMRGQKMNPAVFVYLVEYELVTGERLVKKGSVTIVR